MEWISNFVKGVLSWFLWIVILTNCTTAYFVFVYSTSYALEHEKCKEYQIKRFKEIK